MTALAPSPLVNQVGWMVIHSLWQGAVIAAAVGLGLALLRRRAPELRYLLCGIGLLATASVPVVSVAFGGSELQRELVVLVTIAATSAVDVAIWIPAATTTAATAWFVGVAGCSIRGLIRWLRARRMVRYDVGPAGKALEDASRSIGNRFGIGKPVEVVISRRVVVPAVIGWLRPVILLPVAAATGLTPDQLRLVVAHELAHVARNDYLVNLLQVVVESLMFYHPAVWWLSRRMRVEREYCCDDLVVTSCAGATRYACTLAALEELRAPDRGFVVAAAGGSLLRRIARMVERHEQRHVLSARPMSIVLSVVVLSAVLVVSALTAAIPPAPDPHRPPATRMRVPADPSEAPWIDAGGHEGDLPRRRRVRRPDDRSR